MKGMKTQILYVGFRPDSPVHRRRFDGMRRFASARKWDVELLEFNRSGPAEVREAIGRLRPVGCVVEAFWVKEGLSPRAFGRVPVVCFDQPEGTVWRKAPRIDCDEAAVAQMAFQELADTHPTCFVAVSQWKRLWARERIDAFRDCCRRAGFDCKVALEKLFIKRAGVSMRQWRSAHLK